MNHQTLIKLYKLKGRLKAKNTILDSDISFTERIRETFMTDDYKGYARGKIEVYTK
jgi:hypothetical protein